MTAQVDKQGLLQVLELHKVRTQQHNKKLPISNSYKLCSGEAVEAVRVYIEYLINSISNGGFDYYRNGGGRTPKQQQGEK